MRYLLPGAVASAMLLCFAGLSLWEAGRVEKLSELGELSRSLASEARKLTETPIVTEAKLEALRRAAERIVRASEGAGVGRKQARKVAGQTSKLIEALRGRPEEARRTEEELSLSIRALQTEVLKGMGKGVFALRLVGVLAFLCAVLVAVWVALRRHLLAEAFEAIVQASRGGGPERGEAIKAYGREAAGALFAVRQLLERAEGAEERLREETVSRYLMSEIVRDLSEALPDREAAMLEAGRRFARRLSGSLKERLEAYERQGLGQLALSEVDGERPFATFVGRGLFESLESSEYPQDHFARGFLCETVRQLTGADVLCEEISCRARGDEECRFVVYPLGEVDPQAWREALK